MVQILSARQVDLFALNFILTPLKLWPVGSGDTH